MKKVILALCITAMMGTSNAVASDASMDFLKSLDGKFRGRGIAVLPVSGREERVSCQLDNVLDEESQKLSITGRCATTQGKMEVSGELLIKSDGNFDGIFISPSKDMELKESIISFTENALTISTTTLDKRNGKTSKAKQIVNLDEAGSGFSSVFEYFNATKNEYQSLGTLKFIANNK